MAVQQTLNIDTTPFVLHDIAAYRIGDAVIKQDAGRDGDISQYTLMSKEAATQKWVPFSNEAAVDGTAIPQGIYMGDDIPEADIIAGDVLDNQILITGVIFDEEKLVIENLKTLDTVIDAGAIQAKTVRDHLRTLLLIPVKTISSSKGAA